MICRFPEFQTNVGCIKCPIEECEYCGISPEPQHGREPEWICSRCGYRNAANNEVCMGSEMGDGRCGKPKPEPKPLAQYLATISDMERPKTQAFFQEALKAYQSTENVVIQIIKKKVR